MKYENTGTNTLPPEVTNVSSSGFWLLVHGREYFLSYNDFPWFKSAKPEEIIEVQEVTKNHLRWSSLDVDLSLESIQKPEAFPLVYEPGTSYPCTDDNNL